MIIFLVALQDRKDERRNIYDESNYSRNYVVFTCNDGDDDGKAVNVSNELGEAVNIILKL